MDAHCSPGGWGKTYTDAWTARSNAQRAARSATAEQGLDGACQEGSRVSLAAPARARATLSGCKPSFKRVGLEREASRHGNGGNQWALAGS